MKEDSELNNKLAAIIEANWLQNSNLDYGRLLKMAHDVYNLDRPTPPVETKTAEEILDELSPNRPWSKDGGTDKMIVKAIHAYHAQFTPSAKSVEVEEAIQWDATDEEMDILSISLKQVETISMMKKEIEQLKYLLTKTEDDQSELELLFKSFIITNELSATWIEFKTKEALKEKES